MTFPLDTMAAGMTAAGVAEGEGPGEEVRRQRKMLEEFELALPKTRSPRAARFVIHIVAMMLQAQRENKDFLRMRK